MVGAVGPEDVLLDGLKLCYFGGTNIGIFFGVHTTIFEGGWAMESS